MAIKKVKVGKDRISKAKAGQSKVGKKLAKIPDALFVPESSAKSPAAHPARFFIIGLGASAGGLEAFEQFLRSVPPDSGMAFVLVSHLDPSHTSILTEILQRCTAMPVVEAHDQMKVVPNSVYAIPPNRDMAIFHGALQLNVPEQPRGQRMPIDAFLRSLADDQGENAIGTSLKIAETAKASAKSSAKPVTGNQPTKRSKVHLEFSRGHHDENPYRSTIAGIAGRVPKHSQAGRRYALRAPGDCGGDTRITDIERKQDQASRPGDTRIGMGFGIGVGSGGSFGGMSLGIGSTLGDRHDNPDQPPHIADGANRITVQPQGSTERVEVMSYGHYKMGDCVKVLAGHPSEFPRFFALKPGEHCE